MTATLTRPRFTRADLRAADWSLQTVTFQARHVLQVRPDGEMCHGLRPWYPCSVERAAHYVALELPVRLVTGKPPRKGTRQ